MDPELKIFNIDIFGYIYIFVGDIDLQNIRVGIQFTIANLDICNEKNTIAITMQKHNDPIRIPNQLLNG